FAVTRLLGGAAGRVALDEKQLRHPRLLHGAVRELARQCRPRHDAFADDLLGGLEPLLRIADRELRELVAGLRVLIQPQREAVLDHARHETRALARTEPLLGLAG